MDIYRASMRYISLCSGSKGNCSIIQHQNTVLMIDCGASQKYIKQRLEEIGIPLEKVDSVLITHDHSDHIRSINLCKSIPLYGCTPILGVKPLKPLQKTKFKDLMITPLPLSHDSPNTVGYLIEAAQEKLVYMTDTGYVPKRLLDYIDNAEYYFIESNHDTEMLMTSQRPQYVKARIFSDTGHMCNEYCAQLLDQIIGPSTKEITLAHLSEEANKPELALHVVRDRLQNHPLCPDVHIQAAAQFELCIGGKANEEIINTSSSFINELECVSDV